MTARTLRRETVWTLVYFLLSFAKTIILTPLMLTHWGDSVFCLWAVLLSARALFLFLSDGFVRYAVNEYNLVYHRDATAAGSSLADHFSFLTLLNLFIALLVFAVFRLQPQSAGWLFDIRQSATVHYDIALLAGVYLCVCGMQNGQRMYAATKEARGLVRHNLIFESLLVLSEIVLLSILLLRGADFTQLVWADSALITIACLGYQWSLRRLVPLSFSFGMDRLFRGGSAFLRAGRLYLGNFFEKLSTDGLVLLLSVFRFPKITIAVFSTFRTMVNAPLLAQNLLLNAYTPRLQHLFTVRDAAGVQRLLTLSRVYMGKLLLAGMILCIPLYQPVYLRWTNGTLPFDPRFLTGMLVWCVFSVLGNGYLFVLKGLNRLSEFWLVMALRCGLLLAGFYWAGGVAGKLLWVLCGTELLLSGLLLPGLVHRFWKQHGFTFARTPDFVLLAIHSLVACLLYYFLN